MLFLNIPVAIPIGRRTLQGQLALPATANQVRICITDAAGYIAQRQQARKYAERAVAALNLECAAEMSSGDLLKVIDWVRSRRLLQPLPIALVTNSDYALAALKAAHHRPASVTRVAVTDKRRKRHLTLAYSA